MPFQTSTVEYHNTVCVIEGMALTHRPSFDKCRNNLVPRYLNDRFVLPSHPINTCSKTNGKLCVCTVPKNKQSKRTVRYEGTPGWNSISREKQKYVLNLFLTNFWCVACIFRCFASASGRFVYSVWSGDDLKLYFSTYTYILILLGIAEVFNVFFSVCAIMQITLLCCPIISW